MPKPTVAQLERDSRIERVPTDLAASWSRLEEAKTHLASSAKLPRTEPAKDCGLRSRRAQNVPWTLTYRFRKFCAVAPGLTVTAELRLFYGEFGQFCALNGGCHSAQT